MISLKQLFQSQMTKYFTILFASLTLLLNVGIFGVAYFEYQQVMNRQEESMIELITHLMEEEEHEIVIVYLEHYYHTHGVKMLLTDAQDNTLFQNMNASTELTQHLLYSQEGSLIGKLSIDFDSFVIGREFTVGIVLFNILSLMIFILVLWINMQYLKQQYEAIDQDLLQLGSKNKRFRFRDLHEVNVRLQQVAELEEQLKQNQKQAINTLAHDVKTPLTVMKAYLEGIQHHRLPFNESVLTELLEEIHTIDQIIPKLISQQLTEIPSMCNLSDITKEVIDSMNHVLKTKHIAIVSSLDEVTVFVSKEEAKRVIEHLLYNSFYYSKPNTTIQVMIDHANKSLSIIDQGVGMSEETISLIQKGPYRSTEAASLHQKGNGIGLQIVFMTIKKWNASINITSQLHVGTTITITFES